MLKSLVRLGCVVTLCLLTTTPAAAEIRCTDDLGREIVLEHPATRIISLYSAHTENLFALGLDAEIIGVGRVAEYPPQALTRPNYDYRSDPEKVIAAAPDVVLIRPFITRSHPEFVKMLELAGVRVVSLYPETFEAFDPYIRKLGLLTGKTAEAERRLRQFHADLQAIHTLTQAITPKVRVYFESVARGYKTVTPDSPPARAIALAGGLNAAQDAAPVKAGSSIAAYGAERLLQQGENIDVFVAQQGMMNAGVTAKSIAARPGFAAIKAVAAGRVYVIDEKLISSPTFRYVQGVRQLAQWFYPQIADRLPIPDAP